MTLCCETTTALTEIHCGSESCNITVTSRWQTASQSVLLISSENQSEAVKYLVLEQVKVFRLSGLI